MSGHTRRPAPVALFAAPGQHPKVPVMLSAEAYASELASILFAAVAVDKLVPSYRLPGDPATYFLDLPGCRRLVEKLAASDRCPEFRLLWALMPEASACISALRSRRRFEELAATADIHLAALWARMDTVEVDDTPQPSDASYQDVLDTVARNNTRTPTRTREPQRPMAAARARARANVRATAGETQ